MIDRARITALLFACSAASAACSAASANAAPEPCVIARDGQAKATIVLGVNPCDSSKHTAELLAEMLGKISGATFSVETGDGTSGIAVGLAKEFPLLAKNPALKLDERFAPTDLATRQSYVLRSHQGGVQILGASELGVVYGGWDLLHRLGYRRFTPNKIWEVIPQDREPTVAVDAFEKPDYVSRHIAGSVTPEWCIRNRVNPIHNRKDNGPFSHLPLQWTAPLVRNQHNWGAILAHSRAEFDAHPEYFGLVTRKTGKDNQTEQRRVSSKLCVSNPKVRELAAKYALSYFTNHPEMPSISMEPSDGGGWCECEPCTTVGSPSERVALLANHVAKALEDEFPEKYVGVLAYYQHADPPARRLHPRVVVSLATAMSGSKPIDQRLTEWSKVSDTLGIYEYLSVMEWHLGMPAKSRVAHLDVLAEIIPLYHQRNVRFITGQATGGAWGGHALGYYVISRLLWDVDEAKNIPAIVDDFLVKSFGDAAEPMRAYWNVVDASQAKAGTGEFYVKRAELMYEALRAAKAATKDPAVHARLDQLVLYARYVELFGKQARVRGKKGHDVALSHFVRFAHRIRDEDMVHGYGMVRAYVKGAKDLALRPEVDRFEAGPKASGAKPPAAYADKPITAEDIRDILAGTSPIPDP